MKTATKLLSTLAILAAVPAAPVGAAVVVNLDATGLAAGPLATWTNTGGLAGNFASAGTAVPAVGDAVPSAGGGITKKAVILTGGTTFYAGPTAPAGISGAGARSIEVWVINPSFAAEETMVAWAHRGGPAGTNMSFNYGSHGTWGAVGHWDVPDMNWGPNWGAFAGTTTGAPTANWWHHLVYTYDGTTAVVYADGAAQNSRALALNAWPGNPIVIGGQNDGAGVPIAGANSFIATMSIARVRVHDAALSAAEVREQYWLEAPDFGRTLPPIVNSFTANVTSIASGDPVTLSWNLTTPTGKPLTALTINSGAPAPAVANTGSVVVNPTATTTYTLTATNADGSVTAAATVTVLVPQPLVPRHRWSFNEPAAPGASGAVLADSVGGQNAFIRMVNPAKAVATGTGVTLSGGASATAPYIDLPNGMASARTGGATFEGWVTIAATQNWGRLLDFNGGQMNLGQEIIRPGGTGNGLEYLTLTASVGATATQSRLEIVDGVIVNNVTPTITFTAGTEFHYAVVYHPSGSGSGGPQFRYYRNGAQIATVDTVLKLTDLNDYNCWLGRSAFAGDNNLQGTYNEFRVYDGPMTAAEVTASQAAGANAPTTPAGATLRHRWSFNEPAGTLEADTPLADSVGGAAAYVRSQDTRLTGSEVLLTGGPSASGSYIDLPNGIVSSRQGEATFEGWATLYAISPWSRLMDFGSGTGGELLAPGGAASGNEYILISAHNGTPGAIDPWHPSRCSIRDGTVEVAVDALVPFKPYEQVHFACTYRRTGGSTGGPSIRHYRNGALVAQQDTTYRLQDIIDNNNWLGRSNFTGDANTNGSYNEFRVYDGAMGDEDVAASYGAGPDSPLQSPLHIDLYAATATTIQAGQTTDLLWSVSNPGGGALSVSTTPPSAVSGASGRVSVSPAVTTTYHLNASAGGQTRRQQITITVTPLTPAVTERSHVIPYQAATAVTLTGTDPRSLPLTWSVVTGPASGILSGTAPALTYTPNAGFTGTDTMVVQATNGSQSDTGTITLFVPADVPAAAGLAAEVGHQTPRQLLLSATDPDGEALTWSIVTGPAGGSLSGTAPALTYTPNAGFSGADSFTFKVNDGTRDSNTATVSLTVAAPAAPTAILLSDSTIRTDDRAGAMIARLQAANGSAPEGLTYTLVTGAGDTHNGDFTIAGNQLISNRDFAPDLGQSVSIRLRVTDSSGLSHEEVFTFTVSPADQHVKINEIHYNTPDNTVAGEFIELYNPLPTAVNVENWSFTRGINFTIPAGTPDIPAGGYLVIAENPAVIQALYGHAGALGPWTGGLSSDGDTIELRDAANNRVDGVSFGTNTPWPTSPNGDGPSLELVNPGLDNDLGGNWRAATVSPAVTPLISKGTAGWSYRPGTSEASSPITAWTAHGFALDATWRTNATAPIGLFKVNSNTPLASFAETGVTLGTQLLAASAGADMASFVNSNVAAINNFTVNYQSVFFRRQFTIAGEPPASLVLRILRNDAAIVWINGVEVGRFGFSPEAPANPPASYDMAYELGNDPWMQTVLTNLSGVLTTGANTLAIQGFAKKPRLRGAPDNQDAAGTAGSATAVAYNVFDFAIDAELSTVGSYRATPGAQNSVFAANGAPAVRNVAHSPQMPASGQPITVTARISDRQGLSGAVLRYQICSAANYIPAELPRTNAEILTNIVANPNYPKPANPDYELVANWTSVVMTDDGSAAGDIPGDGIFTGVIPAQAHRTLVRYRIVATDIPGASAQYPAADDSQKNFALYVYNGVPAWNGTDAAFTPDQLQALPVYQMMMRSADFDRLLAYNGADQFANDNQLSVLLARRFYNFECAMIYDGKVYDHVQVRLRGGNSRYNGAGKRHFRFKFPKGYPFMAKDNRGNAYPRPWEDMLFNKMYGNKGDYDWGLPYEAGVKFWGLMGVPMPAHHWIHFRVVRSAAEAPAANTGDFWGLYDVLELPEGKNFLRARDLPDGNFYKMSDYIQNGEMDERYQAQGAPQFAEDFENVRFNTHQYSSRSWMETFIDMPNYYAYNAVQEAIRHYDIFIEPTGRHRIKNLYWWFRPVAGNPLGQCVFMPYDWDASFGPNWNGGRDLVQNALFNYDWVPDSPSWPNPNGSPNIALPDRSPMLIRKRNAIRHLRDLIFYRNEAGTGPVDDILNDAIATVGSAMAAADQSRWPAPGAASYRTITSKADDMRAFCFTGWNSIAGEPIVGIGGRAAYLDTIGDGPDGGQLPNTPSVTYTGTAGFPVDGLTFTASPFSDPQGGAFAAIQWRAGEVAAPTPTSDRIYEAAEVWGSGELAGPGTGIAIPGTALRAGRTYRVRVRYQDVTGRFSHWSAPVEFAATEGTYDRVLTENLYISEVMYKPAPPTAEQAAAPNLWTESDFEYVELTNRSALLTLDLNNARFTKGVDFDFAGSAITSLPPGASVLVVRNVAAFTARYGPDRPVAGEWDAGQIFANGGEQLKLSYGAGDPIHDITYDDAAPWPADADSGGVSMVYFGPGTVIGSPDPQAAGANWKAGCVAGGSPGEEEFYTLSRWMTALGLNDPSGDDFHSGWDNLGTYAFARDLSTAPPAGGFVTDGAGRFLEFTYARRHGAQDVAYYHEVSNSLAPDSWSAADVVTTAATANGDGTETVVIRLSLPVDAPATGVRWFIRARAELP